MSYRCRYMNFWITDNGKFHSKPADSEAFDRPWVDSAVHGITLDLKTGEFMGTIKGEPLAVIAMMSIHCPEYLTALQEKEPEPSSSDPSAP